MIRRITVAASFAALAVLGACSRGDQAATDTATGATAGAMATPPAYPGVGATVGATTGMTTGATTIVIDSTKSGSKRP